MKNLLLFGALLFPFTTPAQQHYPIKNMLMAVGHPWDITGSIGEANTDQKTFNLQNSIQSLKLTGLRVYNDVYACKDATNVFYKLSPEQRGFKTDEALINLKSKIPGLNVLYCYQGQPTNIANEWSSHNLSTNIYRHYGSDPYISSTYSELSHDLAVLTARGGKNKNAPDYPVFISPNWWEPVQQMYKGAAFISTIEGGNEWDNPWGNAAPANGTQYAIALSAMYDSVKKVDPSMMVSTTGFAEADPKIMADVIAWCNQNRSGKRPFDYAQHHIYPWAWPLGLSGGLPGELSIIPDAKKLVTACNGTPLIIGEWSWDINRDSPINAPAFSTYSAEKCRGFLAIRTIVLFSKIGVYSAYWYRINQDYFTGDPLGGNFANDNNGVQFATSALRRQVDDAGHFVRTKVGDYYVQISAFGDYTYADSQRDDTVQMHRLTLAGSPDITTAWTVEKITAWTDFRGVSHPEFTERKATQYFPSGTIYRLSDDSSGVLKHAYHAGGPVELSSDPLFFIADGLQRAPLLIRLLTFDAQKQANGVMLTWQSAQEQDFSHFEVLRNDTKIATVPGGRNNYSLYDAHPLAGLNLYKLKMINSDGSYSYSKTVAVEMQLQLYTVEVFNYLGQLVHKSHTFYPEQVKQGLKPGAYIMRKSAGGLSVSEKFNR